MNMLTTDYLKRRIRLAFIIALLMLSGFFLVSFRPKLHYSNPKIVYNKIYPGFRLHNLLLQYEILIIKITIMYIRY